MTVQKVSLTCWIVFGVMCLAFLPLGAGILAIHALPAVVRVVLAIVIAGGLWWGPFAYGMYLSMAAVKNGDKRLLKRGKAGTAVVLSAKATAIRPSFMMTVTAVPPARTVRAGWWRGPAGQNPKPRPARLVVAGSQACARQGSLNRPSTVLVIE